MRFVTQWERRWQKNGFEFDFTGILSQNKFHHLNSLEISNLLTFIPIIVIRIS